MTVIDFKKVKFSTIKQTEPKLGEWRCYMFGCRNDTLHRYVWQPEKGKEPNWFWRKMQYLCFGNIWEKMT